jgi:hypothetical protein
MEVSGNFHAPATLPQPQCPLNRRVRRPQRRSGRFGEDKNLWPVPEFESSTWASHYIDYAVPSLYIINTNNSNNNNINNK